MLATSYYLIRNQKIQNILLPALNTAIAERLGSNFTINKISVTFFNKINMYDVLLKDQQGDTLMYAEKLDILTNRINIDNRTIYFREIKFIDPKLYLYTDSLNINNIQFFIDSLSQRKDTTKKVWTAHCNKLNFENMHFRFNNYNYREFPEGTLNFDDLEFKNMNLSAKNFSKHSDTLDFELVDFTFVDKSGFKLNHLIAETTISSNEITFDNPYLETPYSIILGQKLSMQFNTFIAFKNKGIISNVDIEANLNPSNLSFTDITFFTPKLDDYDQDIQLSGKISGRINALKGNNLLIKFGDNSTLNADIYFNGLPDVEKTYVFAQIKQLQTHKDDLESLKIPGQRDRHITLPEQVEMFGEINYNGNFTGYFDDFVAYGNLTCDLGRIKSDLILSPDSVNSLSFKGRLQCIDFDIGSVLKLQKLNSTTFDIKIDGYTSDKGKLSASMNGKVSQINFNDYTYQNIDITGDLTEKKFNGNVQVNDPNIFFEFEGLFDFTDEIPVFDFIADVQKANLYRLNFNDQDSSYFASFLAEAKFTGIHPDSITGELKLLNSFFSKGNRQIQLYDFSLKAYGKKEKRHVSLKSDFVDGEITGNISFVSLVPGFKNYVFQYLPSLAFDDDVAELDSLNNFTYNFVFKNTKSLTEFFYPEIEVANNTTLKGSFTDTLNKLETIFISPEIIYDGHQFKNLYFNIISGDSLFSFNLGSETFKVGKDLSFDNFSVYTNIFKDEFDLKLRWNNWDTIVYKGNMAVKGKLANIDLANKPRLEINILPSKVIMRDSVWTISESSVIIDSTSFRINNYNISQNKQHFIIDGKLSKNPNDKLYIEFQNFNLKNINILSEKRNLVFEGYIDGKASLSDVYKSPIFHSDFEMNNLILNKVHLGKTTVSSEWDNRKKQMVLNAKSKRNGNNIVESNGIFVPSSKKIQFDINLNNANIAILEPFFKGAVSNLTGNTTGKLILSGFSDKPFLNGELMLQEAYFKINYLQTTYHFSNKVEFINNNLLVDQLSLNDMYGNKALVNGTITTNYLRHFRYNFNINAKQFQLLNTTPYNNNDYYGTAYASGIISISGPANDILMNINVRTDRNTEFFVPLSSSGEIGEYDFINFVSGEETENTLNFQNPKENPIAGLKLNFGLDITPDAQVQMIFDSKIGDIIKARGEGNLKMDIDNFGMFNIYGQYKITEGDYLFTLQNIINKQFVIEPGGTVTWDGDPIDATIDINAIYKLKSNLQTLLQAYGFDNDNYSKSLPIECQLKLTEKLTNPNIELGIELPTASEEDKTLVNNVINTEEELSRQIFSLLVLGTFLPDRGTSGQTGSQYGVSGTINTTTELLTSQLNHWLSQISNVWDIGLNYYEYHNYDENQSKGRELEVALSTQILNDRVTINGNIDVSENPSDDLNTQAANNIVGDFDLDVKITENGKLRFKAFNKANDYLSLQNSYYTQGVGFFYREEFSSVGDLFKRYWDAIKRDDEEEY